MDSKQNNYKNVVRCNKKLAEKNTHCWTHHYSK